MSTDPSAGSATLDATAETPTDAPAPGRPGGLGRLAWRPKVKPPWLAQILGRLFRLALIGVLVTFMVAIMITSIPGDAAISILGENATPEQIATVRANLGLDDPVVVRYLTWLGNAVTGDLGTSYRTGESVAEAIGARLPVSLEMMLLSQIVAIAFALVFGCLSAWKARHWQDKVMTVTTFGLISAPYFVIGLVLIYVFAVQLKWLPATGFVPLSEGLGPNLESLILPVLSMSAPTAAVYQRVLRADMERTLQEDFILGATAKGMRPANILIRQALRPSSFSLVTLAGVHTAQLIGGLVIAETLFALPGMGRLLIDSINTQDFIMLQGVVAFIAVTYVVVNLAVDLLYLLLDPRVRR